MPQPVEVRLATAPGEFIATQINVLQLGREAVQGEPVGIKIGVAL
jgi:hypothetical protein